MFLELSCCFVKLFKLKIDLIDKLTIIFFVQSTCAVAQCTLCVERIDEIPMSPLPILGGCL